MNEYWILKRLKLRFSPKITAATQRTLTLFEGNQATCTSFVWIILHPATFRLSRLPSSLSPVVPLHIRPLSGRRRTRVAPLRPSAILVLMWRGYLGQTWRGTLIRQGDRLLAVSFVYPSWTGFGRTREREAERRSMSDSDQGFFITSHQSQVSATESSLILIW